MNSNRKSSDEDDEQMARDMQMALQLQAEQEEEDAALARRLAEGGGGSMASAISNGDSEGGGSHSNNNGNKNNPLLTLLGNTPSMFGRQNAHIVDAMNDGSANMETMGNLLHVPCEINGRVVEMMVDSGSQTSVISSAMMRKLKLTKRLNTACQGVAAGVGSANILGRVERCPVVIGHGVEFLLYFLVLDVPHDMMILGIDQMRRFKCMIDLERDVLIFGGQGGVEVPFLPPDPQGKNARDQCTIS